MNPYTIILRLIVFFLYFCISINKTEMQCAFQFNFADWLCFFMQCCITTLCLQDYYYLVSYLLCNQGGNDFFGVVSKIVHVTFYDFSIPSWKTINLSMFFFSSNKLLILFYHIMIVLFICCGWFNHCKDTFMTPSQKTDYNAVVFFKDRT